jgi:hypothetical protein
MAKIVRTQYRENYGSHDWDGTGECPQHWKNKGGSTYVVYGKGDASSSGVIHSTIAYSNEYSEELVISIEDFTSWHENTIWEDWEDRTTITINENGTILQSRKSGTEGLRRGLKSYSHTWGYENANQRKFGECLTYRVQYVFEDGQIANSEEEARAIFDEIAERAEVFSH